MPIYILEIPGSDFTGVKGGVDFCKGRGSTSSRHDADHLAAKAGCRIVGPESEINTGEAPAGASPDLSTPVDEAAKKQDELERNPDSEWSKRRTAEADRKRKRGRK